ncbi:MAG: hypothetical protein J0H85_05825 [Sediminibacterium magnilacihabitans]|jgi:hypothetical protein|nr:hypothetical protein [Sediminibacterium magnilacihabitans]PQV61308.1 hypothetical protein CLV53_103160 [Sediminibacterium magnilacihabitans]
MYYSRPGLIIAFHGCEAAIRNKLLSNPDFIKKSEKPYDWLGHGIYFWENNIDRALEWAKDKKRRGEIDTPAVIGAVLDLGYCFDLSDSRFISMIKGSYSLLAQTYKDVGETLPQNRDIKTDHHKDKILRELDCKVIEFMHDQITNWVATDIQLKGYSEYRIFDSARGVFTEGGPAYTGAGIAEKTHIQLSIRNPNCIKGFFLPRQEIDFLKSSLPKN